MFRFADGEVSFWFDRWLKDGTICNMVDYVHISDFELQVKDAWREGQ